MIATPPAAKLSAELTDMSSTPTAQVSKGLSQKAVVMALEGFDLVTHCHMKAKIAEQSVEVSRGG